MTQQTLAKRYAFKLLANVASIPVYLTMEAVLPRALGPTGYGNYSFATNMFQQFAGFLDMGTSTCFYNALSRRQQEFGLVSFYVRVAALVLAITMLFSLSAFVPGLGQWLLPDVPAWIVPLAALWAFLSWWGRVLRSMNDALGVTVSSEISRTVLNLASVAGLLALFLLGWLNMGTLFAHQYVTLIALAVGYAMVLRGGWPTVSFRMDRETRRAYTREFADYSTPLFVQALASTVFLVAERWLLQTFNGSAQQGFFALSQKVGMACFLFVSAMTPLVMRELSIAWGKGDRTEMGRLMDRFAPLLFTVAGYFSCFTAMEAPAVVRIFGGADYAAAILPVQIMALYPVHQAYGQLAGSVFYATGRTRTMRNMAVTEYVLGFGLSWLLLAPADKFGFGLGAMGLAVKTVLVQFLSVNFMLWVSSRIIPLNYLRNVAHQTLCLAFLAGAAWACRSLTIAAGLGDAQDIVRFFVSGVVYSALVGGAVLAVPQLVGLTRQDLRGLATRALGRLRKPGA
ncbi:lipopolysaccharide biosynthesis protein [Nitratidesulfovibrio sp. HK-II]|uniref:lipopolysaccharide biosynthesis protein n=1 Tax=Nitratidesulfovibrio sp. HK-II TaxID=2009266 RepID=UPI000E2FCD7C|nr:lipopolysaccharide biosynthesis protein [Nitratidesulfovibrio sp. HK-II]GBO97627.1 membrane protein [Nitratidesulfovibrio sp. HK-II]